MSESKSNIFEKPTNEEINTLLFNDDQIPISINSNADVNAQEKSIVNSNEEVKGTGQDSKIENAKLGSNTPELKSSTSDSNSTSSIEGKNDLITTQEISKVDIKASDSKNTSSKNTDPTQKTSNDDDTGVNLQLRLPKK